MLRFPMMQTGLAGKWSKKRLSEQAPEWYRITKQGIQDGTVTHMTVLSRAVEFYRQAAGIQNWQNVPEKYWNLAPDEFGL